MASCCPSGSWPACQAPDTYEAKGAKQMIGDLPVYYVEPETPSEKAILVLPDIFGWSNMGGRFFGICDTFAEQGFSVLLVDPFRGDTAAGKEDMMSWITSFKYEETVGTDIEQCVKWLGEKGATSIGAAGFCWGVWAFCKAASSGTKFKCAVGPHPSTRLEGMFGRDEQEMIDAVNMPVLILPAGNDPDNLKEGGAVAEALVKKGGKVVTYPDMAHGWVSRGDLGNSDVARDTQDAIQHMVEFLKVNM